ALPCRGRDVETRRRLLEDGELDISCRQRRPADRRTEPPFVGPSSEDTDGSSEAKSKAGCHRSGFVDRLSTQQLRIFYQCGRGAPLERRFLTAPRRWQPPQI